MKPRVREAIAVEGRYDKNAVSQAVEALVVETAGFGIFSDEKQLELLRTLADRRGLIVLTDPDGAGFVIRNFLRGALDPARVKHAYVPDIPGKERRKKSPSKEGKLGVEGVGPERIVEALRRAGATFEGEDGQEDAKRLESPLTKADLMDLGLTGGRDSKMRRQALVQALRLPEHIATNALLDVLNILMTRSELMSLLETLTPGSAPPGPSPAGCPGGPGTAPHTGDRAPD